MTLSRYLSAPICTIHRWWYDLDKPAHVALLTCALAALTPLSLLQAAIIGAVAYFGVGKLLVSAELIPHGAHKPIAADVATVCGTAIPDLAPATVTVYAPS